MVLMLQTEIRLGFFTGFKLNNIIVKEIGNLIIDKQDIKFMLK